MTKDIDIRVVLTGTACTGKTSVTDELKRLGYHIIEEPARILIEHFQENDPSKLPWNNRHIFQKEVETMCIENHANNESGFFDRSLVDELGYRKHYGVDIPKEFYNKILEIRYDKVFFFPPWREIYKKDKVRVEDLDLAEAISKSIYEGYGIAKYDVIVMPKISVEERVKFILDNICGI